MADSNYGSLTMWGWVPSTLCYVAALDAVTRSPSPKPLVDVSLSRILLNFADLADTC